MREHRLDVMQTGPFSHLTRCLTVIDPHWQFRVCSGFEE
jgi:hypothetical protein